MSSYQNEINILQAQINNLEHKLNQQHMRQDELEMSNTKICQVLIRVEKIIKDWREN